MSTTPEVTSPSNRVYKNQRGELHFTMVYCPGCTLQFRLLWPGCVRNYPKGSTLHLECPGCKHAFTSEDLAVGKLYHVGGGCEKYPAALVRVDSEKT